MATGAANMAALARRMEKVPDQAVAELVQWFVPRSESVGGKMRWYGGIVQLSSRVKKRRRKQSANSVVLQGTPASCWSIKSYGRQGGYPVKAPDRPDGSPGTLALRSFAPGVFFNHVTIKRRTTGDKRWDRLVAEADARFPDVVADVVARKVIG